MRLGPLPLCVLIMGGPGGASVEAVIILSCASIAGPFRQDIVVYLGRTL